MTLWIFIAVLAAYVVVAASLTRLIKNKDDFYVMGEQGSTLLIVGTLAATFLSAVTLMGIAGISYSEGPLVIGALGSCGAWIGTLIAVVFIGRKLKAMECRTMMDFFDYRFNNKWVSVVALILMVVGLLGYGIIQLIGAGIVLAEIIDVPFPVIIVAFTLALMVFCSLSGMYGVVYTDTMMFFTMLAIAFLIAPMLIDDAGFEAMKGLSEKLPGFWTLGGAEERSLGWSISQFLVWILFFACTPALVSRVFPAKNDFVILKVAVIGVFFAPAMQLLVFLAAAAMQVLQPGIEPADRAMIVGFMEYTNPTLAGIGLAGLMASIMSTASTLFVLTGFALARDLYEKLFDRQVSERRGVVLGRISQAIVALIVCAVAISRPAGIYWISIYAGAIFAVAWLPTIVAALKWRRMNASAALACMLVGSITFILVGELQRHNLITLPANIDNLMIAFVLGTMTLIGVVLATKPSAYELQTFDTLRERRLSDSTISSFLAREDGARQLIRQYRQVWLVMVLFVLIALGLWGFLFVQLGT
ncbi:sodium:solute symporter family protein [Halomonas binhaiensis]|uniref:Sodium:solute symporter family protein n=1 Tax=Halomonas binhaiensis TaxID=2562282 RepID=A0A5C1NIQ7_9GAMM|nr:sodium:solute symporter family protein [Halomonas binhaiensis]QEM82137.1 sodium:solute symporter family protein [Halomonas binhaiensis]